MKVRSLLIVLAIAALMLPACSGKDGKSDAGQDAGPEPFEPGPTVAQAPADPLADGLMESCPIYLQERCQSGTLQRCAVFDTGAEAFTDASDPLLEKVYLYDRWYDLYSSPSGLTAERVFTGAMPGDTPEETWSSFENFSHWAGAGDAAIWTGAALVADIFRYVTTGTEADYQRMEDKTRTLLRNFEVTGVPGFLARYHFLYMPPGSPNSDQIIVRHGEMDNLDNRHNPIESLAIEGLPAEYSQGLPDGQGGYVTGTPMWNGHTSIDQYSGPMTAFPIVYNLLRDQALKDRITHHMTCYLKRLKRLEIINLQDNPDVLEEISAYFGGAEIRLDPTDPDLMALDRLVWYVNIGINATNRDDFDRSCPDTVQLEPYRVIDATSDSFLLDMLDLAADMNEPDTPRPGQIDHFYIVSLRGGDASHMMHLAAMAYYFTGEEQYRSFLFDELIGELDAPGVADTMMAFRLADWCFRYYGDHITYGTHWQLISMLPEGNLRKRMIAVMEEEAWQKALYNHHSAKFNVMYASVVPDGVASDRAGAIASAVAQLEDFSGNGGVKNAPRRTHDVSRQSIIDALPAHIELRCPSEADRVACEEPGDLFGIPLESSIISRDCDGRPGECTFEDGQCADALASEGLPASLRIYADFMWQRSPFEIGDPNGVDGQKQSPGSDLSEPYWLARHYGYITDGAGQVLAWQDLGACP